MGVVALLEAPVVGPPQRVLVRDVFPRDGRGHEGVPALRAVHNDEGLDGGEVPQEGLGGTHGEAFVNHADAGAVPDMASTKGHVFWIFCKTSKRARLASFRTFLFFVSVCI